MLTDDQKRQRDTGGHHRERGKRIAHDHREQRHSRAVNRNQQEAVAGIDKQADDCLHCLPGFGNHEYAAQHRQHLR